jgi:hypothetical protein
MEKELRKRTGGRTPRVEITEKRDEGDYTALPWEDRQVATESGNPKHLLPIMLGMVYIKAPCQA